MNCNMKTGITSTKNKSIQQIKENNIKFNQITITNQIQDGILFARMMPPSNWMLLQTNSWTRTSRQRTTTRWCSSSWSRRLSLDNRTNTIISRLFVDPTIKLNIMFDLTWFNCVSFPPSCAQKRRVLPLFIREEKISTTTIITVTTTITTMTNITFMLSTI